MVRPHWIALDQPSIRLEVHKIGQHVDARRGRFLQAEARFVLYGIKTHGIVKHS